MEIKWYVEYKCRPSIDRWQGYLADLGKLPKDETEAYQWFRLLMSDSSVTDIRIERCGLGTRTVIEEFSRELDADTLQKQIDRIDDIWNSLDYDKKLWVFRKAGLR